ncbi:MAG: sulfotransferase family protein [Deltaproteobacteria bacterium]
MRKLPNFFIVGAAKSGTTSLWAYLNQHPQIYLSPVKEPKYLSCEANNFPHNGPGDASVDATVIKSLGDYENLFAKAEDERALGEASADYLYFYRSSIASIQALTAGAKIIILLRNPVDRAFSSYRHMIRDGREKLSFEDALESENDRRAENWEFIWFYKDAGFYFRQVEAYFEAFGEDGVRVYLYDDFSRNPLAIARDIFGFLGVDGGFTPSVGEKLNASKMPESESFQKFLSDYDHPLKKLLRPLILSALGKRTTERLVNYLKARNEKKISPRAREYLINLYREDIRKLEKLVKRDLSMWLK